MENKRIKLDLLGKEFEIDFDRVKNPKLRQIFRERKRDFLHYCASYEDNRYSEHTDIGSHTDESGVIQHRDKGGGHSEYSERSGHSDCTKSPSRNMPHTDYTDSGHRDHYSK